MDANGNDYRAAINDNWLYTGLNEWTLSRRSDASNLALNVHVVGIVLDGDVDDSGGSAVRPSFSLSSSVKYESGSGTASNPIRLKI